MFIIAHAVLGKLPRLIVRKLSLISLIILKQKMSIQMAIHSLQPLQADHIWARRFEDPQEIEELFKQDLTLFLEKLSLPLIIV